MTKPNTIRNFGLKFLTLGVVGLLSAWLSITSLNAALANKGFAWFDTWKGLDGVYYADQDTGRSRIAELGRRFEFMVWQHEREKLAKDLLILIQAEINANPFDPRLWLDLAAIQGEMDADVDDRIWVLERASVLSKWYDQNRQIITRHCIVSYEEFARHDPTLCASLLTLLPLNRSDEYLASLYRVPVVLFTSVLEQAGVRRSNTP